VAANSAIQAEATSNRGGTVDQAGCVSATEFSKDECLMLGSRVVIEIQDLEFGSVGMDFLNKYDSEQLNNYPS